MSSFLPSNNTDYRKANIAVIGAGWWSQGWHIPQLHRHPDVNLVAIVEKSSDPTSSVDDNAESLEQLGERYQTKTYTSVTDLLADPQVAPTLDGVIVATPHTTHFDVAQELFRAAEERRSGGGGGGGDDDGDKNGDQVRPLHILMEKPMTTDVGSAKELYDLVLQKTNISQVDPRSYFMINHTANYRAQAKMARRLVDEMGAIGQVRHISAFFGTALRGIFEDPSNTVWTQPSDGMLGNGFGWGQCTHILAWIFHVCPNLRPQSVYCDMIHSDETGADVAHAASIRCINKNSDSDLAEVVISMSGTSLLPGDEHSDPPVGKQVRLNIYGTKGAIIYCGVSEDVKSGRLELRRVDKDGAVEYPMGDDDTGFEFENLDPEGTGPESVQSLVQACLGNTTDKEKFYIGADALVGLRSVQTLEAMYRSHHEGQPVQVMCQEK